MGFVFAEDDLRFDTWQPPRANKNPADFVDDLDYSLYEHFYEKECENLLDPDVPREKNIDFSLIAAAKGDDYGALSTSREYCVAYLYGMEAQGLEISWKDVNFSRTHLSYAEEVILIPQKASMHWEYTLRRRRNECVPYILDPVKLKELCPVRKQTNFETDLPSKMLALTVRANWVDPQWFTYHQHQHAVLAGLAIFDFEGSFQFPFLFSSHGGCGGAPPYNNSGTARSALFHHNRGACKKAILGVMRESSAVNSCQLKPSESVFLRAIYQAQSGDSAWVDAANTLIAAKGEGYSDKEVDRIIRGEGVSLPEELENKMIEVQVDSPLIGATISAMRKQGLVMTRLDVSERIQNLRRFDALYQDVQTVGEVLIDAENQKRIARSQSMRLLTSVIKTKVTLAQGYLETVPDEPGEQEKIIDGYFRDFRGGNMFLSSMCFQNRVEIIRSTSVVAHIGKSGKSLLQQSANLEFDENSYDAYNSASISKIPNLEKAESWLESLEKGRREMPPVGFGTRDSHILLEIENLLNFLEHPRIILVTKDKELIHGARRWAHFLKSSQKALSDTAAIASMPPETLLAQSVEAKNRKSRPSRLKLTDPITGQSFMASQELFSILEVQFPRSRNPTWVVLYDEPNIARSLANVEVSGKDFVFHSGGGVPQDLRKNQRKWFEWDVKSHVTDRLFMTSFRIARQAFYRALRNGTVSTVSTVPGGSIWD